MSEMFWYVLIIAAYLPGLYLTLATRRYAPYPILAFAFLGMFAFNAAGSILVFEQGTTLTGVPLFSRTFVVMLIGQALLFYAFTLPYVLVRKTVLKRPEPRSFDFLSVPLLAFGTIGILILYRASIGPFLITDLLEGNLDVYNVGAERAVRSYGLAAYQYYDFGFTVLPSILATQCLFIMLTVPSASRLGYTLLLLASLVPSLLLGEKSGVLFRVLMLLIAYGAYTLFTSRATLLKSMLRPRVFLWGLPTLVPTYYIYRMYYRVESIDTEGLRDLAFYRICGVYAETYAATAPLVDDHGFLNGNSLPKLQGLVANPAHHIGIDQLMHYYLTGFSLGAAPVPALGEGYANYGWIGFFIFAALLFASLIVIQELLLRWDAGLLSYSILTWFGYQAVRASMLGLFSTVLFPTTLLLLVVPWALGRRSVDPVRSRMSPGLPPPPRGVGARS